MADKKTYTIFGREITEGEPLILPVREDATCSVNLVKGQVVMGSVVSPWHKTYWVASLDWEWKRHGGYRRAATSLYCREDGRDFAQSALNGLAGMLDEIHKATQPEPEPVRIDINAELIDHMSLQMRAERCEIALRELLESPDPDTALLGLLDEVQEGLPLAELRSGHKRQYYLDMLALDLSFLRVVTTVLLKRRGHDL